MSWIQKTSISANCWIHGINCPQTDRQTDWTQFLEFLLYYKLQQIEEIQYELKFLTIFTEVNTKN